MSKLIRQKIQKQHEAELWVAKQRLEFVKQMQFRELKMLQIEKEHCKQMAAEILEAIELMTKTSADGSDTGNKQVVYCKKHDKKHKTCSRMG